MPKSRITFLALATLVFLLSVGILHNFAPFVEHAFYDLNFAWAPDTPTDSVVIVGIDHHSVNEVGGYPWRRATMARLVELIASHQPSVIALDFFFPRREGDMDNDSLAAVFSRLDNLVLPFRAGAITTEPSSAPAFIPVEALAYRFHILRHQEDLRLLPLYCTNEIDVGDQQFMQHASRSGFLNVSTSKVSQKLREVIHVLRLGDYYFPSFAIASVARHLRLRPRELILDGKGKAVLGDIELPLTTYAGSAFLNFRGRAGAVETISAARMLRGEVPQGALRGKLVFVGVTDPISASDFFLTPVGPQFPGIEVWATAALDILNGSWIRKEKGVVAIVQWLAALALFPGLALLFPDRRRTPALLIGLGIVAAAIAAGILLFHYTDHFLNPGYHLYAWAFCAVWYSIKKPETVSRTPMKEANLDLDQPADAEPESLPPPREQNFMTSIPRTETAVHVAKKVEESAPLLSIGMGSAESDDADGGEEDLVAEVSKLAGGRIIRPLGSGGMADVYLVWNPRMEVYRAVKVLKPDQPARILDRFETEIRIFANLNHSNIVQCYSVGEWHGLPYLEMDYLNGISFDRLLRKVGPMSPAETCAVGILVARALHYAHTQDVTVYGKTYRGVIHRDLKPANILLSRGGRIKLTDFGIARPVSVSLHTMDQSRVVGTLPYLAPEQCAGKAVTARTDVYALGETLYEMVCGRRSFPQEDVMSCATAKSNGDFEPPGKITKVPRGFDVIIRKSMATKPEARYGSAAAMCTELESLLTSLVTAKECRRILPRLAGRYWA